MTGGVAVGGPGGRLNAPDFRCDDCGRSVGARKRGPDHDWEPQECFWCRRKEQQRDAARRRKLGHVVAGVDLDKALAAYKEMHPFKGNLGRRKITLQVVHSGSGSVRATAYTLQRRIRLVAGPRSKPARLLEVLVHELVHLACPDTEHHGERFRRVLRRAFLELWDIAVPLNPEPRWGVIAYGMDEIAIDVLEEKIERGEVDVFPADPTPEAPPKKTNRAEVMAKVVEKRAAHAMVMHKKSVTRLKRAKTIEEKWRKKVRYYERQAAKKGGG